MKAIFNFRIEITENEVKTSFSTEKVENMGIIQQQGLLKVFSDVDKKITRILNLGNQAKDEEADNEENAESKEETTEHDN